MKNLMLSFLLIAASNLANAQDETESTIDPVLDNRISKIEEDIRKGKKLKITGYIHAQYQVADSEGVGSYAAGNFPAGEDKRFAIRRGRIKTVYENNNAKGINLTQIVFQLDFTEKGFQLRDAYGKITDPWIRWFGLKAGAMDRPFSYELTYSSSVRETPERGRMSQILLPSEKDLGAQFIIAPPKSSVWHGLKLETGLYNGTGIAFLDFDKKKDWISRLSFNKENKQKTVKYSGGFSYLNGGFRNGTKYIYGLATTDSNKLWRVSDSSKANTTKFAKRLYYGIDAQTSVDWKLGITTLRAEYIFGTQAGTPTSSTTPTVLPTANNYTRQFNGAYFYFIQNILHSKHDIVIKYDWYDPDTKVNKDDFFTPGNNLTVADIKYNTLGLGYNLNYDENWKFTLYYDIVKNEKTNIPGYGTDLKDNILTLRMMYRF